MQSPTDRLALHFLHRKMRADERTRILLDGAPTLRNRQSALLFKGSLLHFAHFNRVCGAIVVLLVPLVLGGCVRRRLLVRTNPPNAAVFTDDKPIGQSPAATSFTYYGTRKLEIVADGYRTETIYRKFSPPWYQIPPLDFFFETLWPWELRDERIVDVTLVPEQLPPIDTLIENGQGLRTQASQGFATPVVPAGAEQVGVFPPNALPGIAPQPSPYGADALPAPGFPSPTSPSDFAPGASPGIYPGNVAPPNNGIGAPTRIPEFGTYRPSIESGR